MQSRGVVVFHAFELFGHGKTDGVVGQSNVASAVAAMFYLGFGGFDKVFSVPQEFYRLFCLLLGQGWQVVYLRSVEDGIYTQHTHALLLLIFLDANLAGKDNVYRLLALANLGPRGECLPVGQPFVAWIMVTQSLRPEDGNIDAAIGSPGDSVVGH